MKTEDIYTCLSDPDRMRIVNLLADGPLCGCMIQEILVICQVKVSKQLAYLKKLGAVDSKREANWVVYFLSEPVPSILAENLRLVRADVSGNFNLAADLEKRRAVLERVARGDKAAPQPVRKKCCMFSTRD
jgi:DNA-binding transcriptional ArsR family regulator